MSTCLITGCRMILASHPDVFRAADLHVVGDSYAIVANPHAQPIEDLRPFDKVVTVYGQPFEQRDVYVTSVKNVHLNEIAQDYIK